MDTVTQVKYKVIFLVSWPSSDYDYIEGHANIWEVDQAQVCGEIELPEDASHTAIAAILVEEGYLIVGCPYISVNDQVSSIYITDSQSMEPLYELRALEL